MDDSFRYIISAQNLVAGNGLRWLAGDGKLYPLTHFPPLFSLTLALFEWMGINAISAARVVNTLAFGVNLFLSGVLIKHITRSRLMAFLGCILILSSDVLIEAHAWAMSEPLFLSLYLGSVILMVHYLERPALKWTVGTAVLLGLSFLTRYVGVAFIIATMLTMIFALEIPKARRWKDLLTFAVISLLPVVGWVTYTLLAIGSPTDRTFDLYLITTKQILRTFNTVLVWFIPGRLVNGYEVIWLVALAAGGFSLWFFTRKQIQSKQSATGFASRFSTYLFFALQFVCYIPIIFLSKSFFDPLTPLNNRILLPLLPISLMLVMQLLAHLWNSGGQFRHVILTGCALILLGTYAYRAALLVPRLHETGLGFARKSMHTSPILAAVRAMPQTPLFSNSPAAITMWTGLPAYGIPTLDEMRQRMANEGALLVVFDAVSLDLYNTNLIDLTQGLEMVEQYRDGAIYRWNSP